jgi:acetyltransferase-like isoleucine patch superfamily enzyme
MPGLGTFLVKIRRGETPFYRFLYRTAKASLLVHIPVPRVVAPVFRGLYHLHFFIRTLLYRTIRFLYWEPIFRGRCDSVGKNLSMILLPDIASHVQIHLGDNVHLNGFFNVGSGRSNESPRLVIGDNVQLGHHVTFTINKEIVIEEGVMIADYCYFADTDAHPLEPDLRVAGLPPALENIKPVRLCRNSWIGHGVHILKGVTVGEAAVVAAGSVVSKDVPPFSVVAGNPARVVIANILEVKKSPSKLEPTATSDSLSDVRSSDANR